MEELRKELEAAKQEIKQLQNEKSKKQTFDLKVSNKGCVQINGIRKFPISLYPEELDIIFSKRSEIEDFININKNDLTFKN